jgi:hypothetical protein
VAFRRSSARPGVGWPSGTRHWAIACGRRGAAGRPGTLPQTKLRDSHTDLVLIGAPAPKVGPILRAPIRQLARTEMSNSIRSRTFDRMTHYE